MATRCAISIMCPSKILLVHNPPILQDIAYVLNLPWIIKICRKIIYKMCRNYLTMHLLGFTNRGGIQTLISVPVKGFFSKFGCELHWGVVQLGKDHGAPPAPCRGAQGCTGVQRGARVHIFHNFFVC